MTGEDDTVSVVVDATLAVVQGCGVEMDYNINMSEVVDVRCGFKQRPSVL